VKRVWLIAGVVGLLGVTAIAFAVLRPSGPAGYLKRYQQVSADGDSRVYTTGLPPRQVYDDLRRAVPPAQTFTDPGGYFLRYRNNIVAVTPDGSGSRVFLDDDRRGYARWYPYVGGYWGTYSGTGESVRGGGPGAGK
jgi:hypothetical protein